MSSFVLWTVILFGIRVITNTLALANGWKVRDTPGAIACRILMNAAWVAWGIYLLAQGA